MTIRAGRLLVAAPLAELLSVAGMLVPGFAVFFTLASTTATGRIMEMQSLALWTAPLAGFVFCLLGGWWIARGTTVGHERSGLVLGVSVAMIDLALLAASGAPFGALYVSSPVARIAGGYCGALLAKRRAARLATA